MNTFKVGDLVRVTDQRRGKWDVSFTGVLEGKISAVPTDDWPYYLIEDDTIGWRGTSLELVPEPRTYVPKPGELVEGTSFYSSNTVRGIVLSDEEVLAMEDTAPIGGDVYALQVPGYSYPRYIQAGTAVPITPVSSTFLEGVYLVGTTRTGEIVSGYRMDADENTMSDEYLINVPNRGGMYILKISAALSFETPVESDTKTDSDPVKHPSHYTDVVPGIECIDVVKHFPFSEGNAIKYIWRSRNKGSYVENIDKAIQNLEFAKAKWIEENE